MQTILKTIVIGMGILIAIGLGLLVFGFYKTSQDPTWRLFGGASPPAIGAPPGVAAPLALPGSIELSLPTGCEITGATPQGRLLYVLTGPRNGASCGFVLVVDPVQGRVVQRINP